MSPERSRYNLTMKSPVRIFEDEFGHRSHTLAAAAAEAGHLSDILPFTLPGTDKVTSKDVMFLIELS